jgi:hypothetical protein
MEGVDLSRPPAGVKYSQSGGETVVIASHRSLLAAFGTLLFALFWNGIVSIFVVFAIVSTLYNLQVPLPGWFPSPEINDSPAGPGMTIFLWLFLTPFILIGLSMIGAFLMSIGGQTRVRIDYSKGSIFTGLGPLGYRRRFAVSSVSDVRIGDKVWRDSDGDRHHRTSIDIETREGKIIRFGTMLSEKRRKFVAAVVHKALIG